MFKIYVRVKGKDTIFDNYEDAARFWDGETFMGSETFQSGDGIGIQEFHGDTMVRDGWLLHIGSNGSIYISPMMV